MKKSKFNLVTEKDDNVIIYNSLKNSLTVLSKKNYQTIPNDQTENLNSFLSNQGIIIEDDYDEDKAAITKYHNIIDDGMLELIILPTLKCNFKCPYCYEEKTVGKMTDEVIDAIVNFAKQKIARARGLHLSWFGGEPLLCMDVIEKLSSRLMKLARAYRKGFSSNITTNGYLLDVDTFKKLLYDFHITHYQITLDGCAEFHNKTRPLANGDPTYDRILKNLIAIKENIKSGLFTILVRTNLTKDSLQQLKKHIAELEHYFADDSRFVFLFKEVGNWGGESVKSLSDSLIKNSDDQNEGRLLTKKIVELKPKLRLSGQFNFFNGVTTCYASKMGTYTIDPLGKVMRCTVHLNDEYNHIGDLDKKGNLIVNEKNMMKWTFCGHPAEHKHQKCEDCSLYANCFGIMCPIPRISNNAIPNCDGIINELLSMYSVYPEYFLSYKEERYE